MRQLVRLDLPSTRDLRRPSRSRHLRLILPAWQTIRILSLLTLSIADLVPDALLDVNVLAAHTLHLVSLRAQVVALLTTAHVRVFLIGTYATRSTPGTYGRRTKISLAMRSPSCM